VTNRAIFQYLDLAVRSMGRSRQHYAVNSAERDSHHHEMLEVLYALEAVKALVPHESFPQWCFLCGGVIQTDDGTIWHGLGNCVEICERCGGSGEEPKKKEGVISA
jgi:hypothetical protein